jgi:hypothetical protein
VYNDSFPVESATQTIIAVISDVTSTILYITTESVKARNLSPENQMTGIA